MQRLRPFPDRRPITEELRQRTAGEEQGEAQACGVGELASAGQRRLRARPRLPGIAESEEGPRQAACARDERVEDIDERLRSVPLGVVEGERPLEVLAGPGWLATVE